VSTLEVIRLFLHVLAATIWVGGQLTLAALVPVLRRVAPESTKPVAQQFRKVAWPAFAVLVATGVWNMAAQGDEGSDHAAVLGTKMVFVILSGLGAYLHQRSTTPKWLAIWGAVGTVGALVALLLGVVLGGSS
jgi:putative copper export protein